MNEKLSKQEFIERLRAEQLARQECKRKSDGEYPQYVQDNYRRLHSKGRWPKKFRQKI